MDRREDLAEPNGYNTDLMSYYTLEDIGRLRDDSEHVGVNVDAEFGYRPDGTKVYVKDADSQDSDIVQSHIAADIFGHHSPTVFPEIAYDDVYGKILIEEMPGEFTDDFSEMQRRPLHRAAAEKMLVGDADYAGNFLVIEDMVVPIDYDSTGRDMLTVKRTMNTAMGDVLNEDLLHREASQIADRIDLRALEEEMRDERYLMSEWESEGENRDPAAWDGLFRGSIDNILNNIRAFQY